MSNGAGPNILLCIAIDVSESMKESIGRELHRGSSRFQAVQQSLRTIAQRGKSEISKARSRRQEIRFDVFSYVFGLKTMTYCDLLSLAKLGDRFRNTMSSERPLPAELSDAYDDIISILRTFGINDLHRYRQWAGEILTVDEAVRLRRRIRQYPVLAECLAGMLPENFSEIEERVENSAKKGATVGGAVGLVLGVIAAPFTGGASLLPSLLASGAVAAGGAVAGASHGKRSGIEREHARLAKPEALAHELAAADDTKILEIVAREGTPQLLKVLTDIGERIVPFESLEEEIEEGSGTLEAVEGFGYGNTPMVAALTAICDRFERELAVRRSAIPILFLVSDGQPTDGDPLAIAEEIKSRGVHIVSCYVTNENISRPRALYNEKNETWSDGAKLMFSMASDVQAASEFHTFLVELGWKIPLNARSFVQVNNPKVLDEFLGIVLSTISSA